MTDFLLRRFVKDYQKTGDSKVRTDYCVFGSIAGIIIHFLMFVVKLFIGLMTNSLAIISDSFMGLTDATSSVFSIIGARLAGKPANSKRPFGYGRIEYMTAFVIAVIILAFGGNILYHAIARMINPEEMEFSIVAIIIMLLSVTARLTLGSLHRSLGKRINSSILLAAAQDAKGDSIITSLSVVSLLVYKFTNLQLDAYLSTAVSVYIIFMGLKLIKETLSPLIGEAAAREALSDVVGVLSAYPDIKGSHEFVMHEYGPTLKMASIHLEIPVECSFEQAHELTDKVEQEVMKKYGVRLVAHADPRIEDSEELKAMRDLVTRVVKRREPKAAVHDLRMMMGIKQSFCVFDLELPFGYEEEKIIALKLDIMVDVEAEAKDIICAIRVTNSYVEE